MWKGAYLCHGAKCAKTFSVVGKAQLRGSYCKGRKFLFWKRQLKKETFLSWKAYEACWDRKWHCFFDREWHSLWLNMIFCEKENGLLCPTFCAKYLPWPEHPRIKLTAIESGRRNMLKNLVRALVTSNFFLHVVCFSRNSFLCGRFFVSYLDNWGIASRKTDWCSLASIFWFLIKWTWRLPYVWWRKDFSWPFSHARRVGEQEFGHKGQPSQSRHCVTSCIHSGWYVCVGRHFGAGGQVAWWWWWHTCGE